VVDIEVRRIEIRQPVTFSETPRLGDLFGVFRRRLLRGALDEMGFTYGEPRGGLYIWANTAATGIPALELSSLFLDEDVLIFPGTGFGENWGHFVRMTLLQPIEVLAEAVARMKRALARRQLEAPV